MTTTPPPASTADRVTAALAAVLAEITRTDGKAGALLTALGLPLAVLVAVLPGGALSGPAAVLAALGAVGLLAAMLTVLAVIRPRITKALPGSYLHWAGCTPEELASDLAADPVHHAAQVIHLSQIAVRKYKALRLAADLARAALVLLAAALLVGALV
ncbi:Pycsar system effector family protein [Streptomyces sp. NPDC006339]|uniref:Pycsar system effector family protein n=1 Tax=Streptomyces sp. NPDC006339 TaxID=3156755 RepID=UPI0033B9DDA4